MREETYPMDFKRHFSRDDVERLFDKDFSLPDDFLFGVANAGYQVEGGFNGPGEPLNNWVELERSGKVERSGEAVRFWTDYPEQIELARGMGLNGFRLGVEWARVQPSASPQVGKAPPFDDAAIEAYSDMIAEIMKAGMEPVVTLHHFTHPYWLGIDFWLEREKLGLFSAYVEEVSGKLSGYLVEKHGQRPIKYWITINEPNGFSMLSYAIRYFPHKRSGLRRAVAALNNMIDAHCRAYDAVHRVYEDNGWEAPLVTYNTIHFSIYQLDKFVTDLLNARRNDVERGGIDEYIKNGRAAWDDEVAKCPEVFKAPWINRHAERDLVRGTDRLFKLKNFEDGINAIYSSERPQKLDYLAVDFYDPFFRHMFKLPTLQDIREKRFNFNAEHWEWVLNPEAMYHFLKAETINGEGLPLMIAENGMCHKVHRGRVEARSDGATRDRFLQCFIYEAMRALKDGVPLRGYFYWTMVDNYEWGSCDPRFGLFTVDRTRGARLSSVDAWGVNASKAYGEIIGAIRSADRERIAETLLRDYW